MKRLIVLLASAGYVGFAPVAPGTFGSLVGIPLFFLFHWLEAWGTVVPLLVFTLAVGGACWVAGEAEKVFGEHDSGRIVIDEVVGYLAATLFLPPTWGVALAAFLVFRVLDVLKPYPANVIDARLPGGAGVTLDDVVSGLYSNLILRLLIFLGLPLV